jgi:glycerol-3-phosphate dehydrogenase (NAD(P)+)
MIAEGYYAADSIFKTSRDNKMETPIIDAIYKILYEEKNAEKVFQKLTTVLN